MRACVFCKTRYEKGSGVTFHRFPTDSTKLLWLRNMQKENWNPKPCDHLCSQHFTEDCFIQHATRKQLKKCSVPTLFFEKIPLCDDKTTTTPLCDNKATTPTLRDDKFIITPLCDDKATITPWVSETAGVETNISRVDTCLEASTSASEEISRIMPEVCVKVEHDYQYENTPARSVSETCKNIRHDHYYETSPRSTEKKLQQFKKSLKMSRARVKVLSQHVKRLKATVSSLKKRRGRK